LGLLLGLGSVRFDTLTRNNRKFSPLILLIGAGVLPLIAAGFDQLYLNTVLRYTDAVSISIANISATAEWMVSPEGKSSLSTHLSVTSEMLWFMAIAEVLTVFMLSRWAGKRPHNDTFATA
jgi:hypothetical protein